MRVRHRHANRALVHDSVALAEGSFFAQQKNSLYINVKSNKYC